MTTSQSRVRQVVDVARDRNVMFLAASVAYYAFVSLIPLALLVVVLGSALGGQAFAQFVVQQVASSLSSSAERVLQRALTSSSGRTGAGVVGVVTVAWSALKLFRGLDIAFSEAYGTERDPSLVEQLVDGAVTVGLVVVAAGFVIAVGYALRNPSLGPSVPLRSLVGNLLLVAGLSVAFLPVYYVMPPVEMTVREAVPGAVVAAVGWVALHALFQFYLAYAGRYRAYGVIGAVLLLLTWFYFAGAVVLVGAVVNSVLGGRIRLSG
ncbi:MULTISPECIES: YihY/virulence factor BrkB family protein [Halorussus]|uniref:YihY/virulence factor BrkB family protein n=1 Tax=Halorussus TaxID=1070314 RepID=UPI000E2198DE|nr:MULTISPECIES: YihY/virulence factor BrkB family protein [Halorussus]NHN59250.1 YihY/virulence factor BrkB family protein [Halorussus sp. JP-T4]